MHSYTVEIVAQPMYPMFHLELVRGGSLCAVRALADEDLDSIPQFAMQFGFAIQDLVDWEKERLVYLDSDEEKVYIEGVSGDGILESVLDAYAHWPFISKIQYSVVPRPQLRNSVRSSIVEEFPDVTFPEIKYNIEVKKPIVEEDFYYQEMDKKEIDKDEWTRGLLATETFHSFLVELEKRQDEIQEALRSGSFSSSPRSTLCASSLPTDVLETIANEATQQRIVPGTPLEDISAVVTDELSDLVERVEKQLSIFNGPLNQCTQTEEEEQVIFEEEEEQPLDEYDVNWGSKVDSEAAKRSDEDYWKEAYEGWTEENEKANELFDAEMEVAMRHGEEQFKWPEEPIRCHWSDSCKEQNDMLAAAQYYDKYHNSPFATLPPEDNLLQGQRKESRMCRYRNGLEKSKQQKEQFKTKVVLLSMGRKAVEDVQKSSEDTLVYKQRVTVVSLCRNDIEAKLVVVRKSPGAHPVFDDKLTYLPSYVATKIYIGLIDHPSEETSFVTYQLFLDDAPISPPFTIFAPAAENAIEPAAYAAPQEQQRALTPPTLITLPPLVQPAFPLTLPEPIPLQQVVVHALPAPPKVEALPAPPEIFLSQTLKGMISRKNSTETPSEEEQFKIALLDELVKEAVESAKEKEEDQLKIAALLNELVKEAEESAKEEDQIKIDAFLDELVKEATESIKREEEQRASAAPMLIIEETAEEEREREEGDEISEAEEVKAEEDEEKNEETDEEVDEEVEEEDDGELVNEEDAESDSVSDVEEINAEEEESDEDSDFEVIEKTED